MLANFTFTNDLTKDDILVIKTKSATKKNANGVYELASNLERNPLNNNIGSFTLGEVNDHVLSICELRDDFVGDFPGTGNLRDLGTLASYGTKYESLGELINKVIGYDNLTSGRCPNIEALYKENV